MEAAEIAYDELRARAEELTAVSELGPVVDALMCVKGVGFATARAFAAEVGGFSRFVSGRKVTARFGFVPSENSSADSRKFGHISKSGCALVRRLLVECAWIVARGNSACRKKGKAFVPFAIREHARACSGRIVERRRSLVSRGLMPCKANTATVAEMARMLLYIGRDAQAAVSAGAVLAA